MLFDLEGAPDENYKQTDAEELKRRALDAADSYYNGVPIMSDKAYDRLVGRISEIERDNPSFDASEVTEAVGAPVSGRLEKVRHKHPALSLDKTKDVLALLSIFESAGTPSDPDKLSVVMWKLDGCTLQLTYKEGRLVMAATRGNGVIGQNVLHNVPAIAGIPTALPDGLSMTVRGEVTISYTDFKEINSKLDAEARYKNPRNLASASLSVVDTCDIMDRRLMFSAFELVSLDAGHMDESASTMSGQLSLLESLGFGVVNYATVHPRHLENALEIWSNAVTEYDVPVDGLVVALDDREYAKGFEGTSHHPHPYIGYALKWADEAAHTTLRKIEWSLSRTSRLNPVAVFDPVELEGTTVERAALHNFSIMRGLHLRVGDTISVYKANKIIPQIDENLSDEESSPEYAEDEFFLMGVVCPVCGSKASLDRTPDGVEIASCPNPKCSGKVVQTIVHYASRDCMDIRGISEQTIQRFVKLGWLSSPADLYLLWNFERDIVALDGFGPKSFSAMMFSIEGSRQTTLPQLLASVGIPEIGKQQAVALSEFFNDDAGRFIRELAVSDLTAIDGFGPAMNEAVHTWWDDAGNRFEFVNLVSYLRFEKPERASQGGALEGLTFCITGSLEVHSNRAELESVITKGGGKPSSSVSGSTDYLVCNSKCSTSAKARRARDLGIPVITEHELLDMIQGS